MGLGDFVQGLGDAIVPEGVENAVGGVVHGVQTAASVAGDVAQGAAWAVNPTHWDDIGRGAGAVGSFVGEHPGQAWDMAFEVGRHVVKEEILDPKNLAINLGLLAATTLTGGGAGAAWLAKMGEGARVGIGAMRAARAGEEGFSLARGVEAGATAMRGAETAWRAARAERAAVSGVRGAEAVSDAASLFGRASQKVTDVAEFMPRQFGRAREAITGSELSTIGRGRAAAASAFEGSNPGIAREMFGDVIRGSKLAPQTAGAAGGAERFAQGAYAVNRAQANIGHVNAVGTAGRLGEDAYQLQHHPVSFVMDKLGESNVARLEAGLNVLQQAHRAKGLKDKLGNNDDPKKKKMYQPQSGGGVSFQPLEAPVSASYRTPQQRSLGTSQEQYVESDFTVQQDRLGSFYQGMYQDKSIYDEAGAA